MNFPRKSNSLIFLTDFQCFVKQKYKYSKYASSPKGWYICNTTHILPNLEDIRNAYIYPKWNYISNANINELYVIRLLGEDGEETNTYFNYFVNVW